MKGPSHFLFYLAGPIGKDPIGNMRRATLLAHKLEDRHLNLLLLVPHQLMAVNLVSPRSYERWMEYDFGIIEHCQGLLRMTGESPGADREVEFACTLGLPVFFQEGDDESGNFPDLDDWLIS